MSSLNGAFVLAGVEDLFALLLAVSTFGGWFLHGSLDLPAFGGQGHVECLPEIWVWIFAELWGCLPDSLTDEVHGLAF